MKEQSVVVLIIVVVLGLFGTNVRSWAQAYTNGRGNYGEVAGPSDPHEDAWHTTSFVSHVYPYPNFSISNFIASADADGHFISYPDARGPIMNAYARALDWNPYISAAALGESEWRDNIRLDDEGDPFSLDNTPADYLMHLQLGFRIQTSAVLSVSSL